MPEEKTREGRKGGGREGRKGAKCVSNGKGRRGEVKTEGSKGRCIRSEGKKIFLCVNT